MVAIHERQHQVRELVCCRPVVTEILDAPAFVDEQFDGLATVAHDTAVRDR
jgi:hypothetical protein